MKKTLLTLSLIIMFFLTFTAITHENLHKHIDFAASSAITDSLMPSYLDFEDDLPPEFINR